MRHGSTKRRQAALRDDLGAACAYCGSQQALHFDCVIPAGHEHHARGSKFRALFYALQRAVDNVQLLCTPCEEIKRQQDQLMLNMPQLTDPPCDASSKST